MVFGNNLIDFAANGMIGGTITYPAPTTPLQSTIGQTPSLPPSNTPPKKILPLEITKTYTGLTFTLKLDGSHYMGCGPQDSKGDDYNFGGACVSYSSSLSKGEIERKLLKFLKNLRNQEEEQKKYDEAQAKWEQDKVGCESEQKEGSTFSFVNEDRNYAPVGPPTESWVCMESIAATETEREEETPDEGEETDSEGVIVAQSNPQQGGAVKNLSIGFSQGLRHTIRRGVLVGGVLLVGYGAYKIEDRTKIVSNLFKGKKKTDSKKPKIRAKTTV